MYTEHAQHMDMDMERVGLLVDMRHPRYVKWCIVYLQDNSSMRPSVARALTTSFLDRASQ